MLAAAADRLRCPHCGERLALAGRALRCPRGHSYDLARQGYVTLLAPGARPPRGDTAAMVAARAQFLAGGHYAPIADAVASAALAALGPRAAAPGCVVEVGAGTAYHLARVLAGLPGWVGLALDSSRPALRRAARAERIGAVACDVWRALPVRDGAAALALCVFAPRNGEEIARVLAPGGALVVVTPTQRHLAELAGPLGLLGVDPRKPERLQQALGPAFERVGDDTVELALVLPPATARTLALMGPSAHHVEAEELERRASSLPNPVAVTASVVVETFRRERLRARSADAVTRGEQA